MRLLRSSSVTPNCAPSRRICWHRAQLRGGAVLAAAGQADAPGSNRRARPLRRLCGSRAQTSPHRPKGPRRRRGCNRRGAATAPARPTGQRPASVARRASSARRGLSRYARISGVRPGLMASSAPTPTAETPYPRGAGAPTGHRRVARPEQCGSTPIRRVAPPGNPTPSAGAMAARCERLERRSPNLRTHPSRRPQLRDTRPE